MLETDDYLCDLQVYIGQVVLKPSSQGQHVLETGL